MVTSRTISRTTGPILNRSGTVFAAFLVLALLTLGAPAAVRSAAVQGLTLEEANERWRGAGARTRQEIWVKKGSDRDGWSKSRWLWWGAEGSNERARVYFSETDAVTRSFRGGLIPPGTEVSVLGWGVEDGGSIYIEVQLPNLPSRGRVFFWDDWVGKVSENRLTDFERWVRFELLELTTVPEEQLADVAVLPRGEVPPLTTRPGTEKPQAMVGHPNDLSSAAVRLVAVTVEPSRVAPGHEAGLIAVYEVEGVPPGSALPVTERRTILGEGRTLTTVEAVVHRRNGLHQSSQPMRLPENLAEGVYELRVAVEMAASAAERSAIFQVTDRPARLE